MNAVYERWARQVSTRQLPPGADCPDRLQPTLVTIHEQPVGQLPDTATAVAGWLAIGIGLLVAIMGIYLVTQ